MKFMVLYQSPTSARATMDGASMEQMQAAMGEWLQWREKSGGEQKVQFGMPLQADKHITADGTVTDATLATVTGYAIVEADSLDAAVERLKDHPHLKREGSAIEVLEFVAMPGLEDKYSG